MDFTPSVERQESFVFTPPFIIGRAKMLIPGFSFAVSKSKRMFSEILAPPTGSQMAMSMFTMFKTNVWITLVAAVLLVALVKFIFANLSSDELRTWFRGTLRSVEKRMQLPTKIQPENANNRTRTVTNDFSKPVQRPFAIIITSAAKQYCGKF